MGSQTPSPTGTRGSAWAGGVSEIAQRAGLAGKPNPDGWRIFVSRTTGRELSTNIMNWRARKMQPDRRCR